MKKTSLNPTHQPTLLLATLVALAGATVVTAQTAGAVPGLSDHPGYPQRLTLAPAEPGEAGGGGGESQEALAQAAQNPVANMISVPLQNNFNFGIGPNDVTQWVLNIQPVIPVKLSEDWNLITRTIMPIINMPSPAPGIPSAFGLGDINPSFFFSPAKSGQFIWGAGPSFTFPTATDSLLGNGKWCAGPAAVVLTMRGHWVIGVLANQQWSYAGWGNNDFSAMLIQPFINYNLPHGWYLVTAPIITANWNANSANRWTVPVGGGVGKIQRFGKLPLNISLSAFWNAETPQNWGADWQMRFQVQFLFPK